MSGNLNPIPSVADIHNLNMRVVIPTFSTSPIEKGYQPVESNLYFQNENSLFVPHQLPLDLLHSRLIERPVSRIRKFALKE